MIRSSGCRKRKDKQDGVRLSRQPAFACGYGGHEMPLPLGSVHAIDFRPKSIDNQYTPDAEKQGMSPKIKQA
jgi:hypothetical protein